MHEIVQNFSNNARLHSNLQFLQPLLCYYALHLHHHLLRCRRRRPFHFPEAIGDRETMEGEA